MKYFGRQITYSRGVWLCMKLGYNTGNGQFRVERRFRFAVVVLQATQYRHRILWQWCLGRCALRSDPALPRSDARPELNVTPGC
jgi:hypothetical protein